MVANLPYYLVTPLLFKLLQGKLELKLLLLMVQLEVAERITAAPGGRNTTCCRFFAAIAQGHAYCLKFPAMFFFPPPEVDSAVVLLEISPDPHAR